jgi:23S rRNA (uracil1939-C5)-methyltransferase
MSALCRHFGTCGGCTFQDMPHDTYRDLKRAQIVQALSRYGFDEIAIGLPAEVAPGTRRRGALKALKESGVVQLGFRAARSHRTIDLAECRVLTPALVALLPPLRELLTGLLREGEEAELRLTEANNGIDLEIGARSAAGLRHATTLARWAARFGIARVTIRGEPAVQFASPAVCLGGVEVEIPPASFLQPTHPGELLLQEVVQNAMKGARRIVDLFAGCGTFALALAAQARVHAVDADAAAIAALLAATRKTQKLKPVTAEVRDLFKRPLSAVELDGFDAAVLDPPRAGAAALAKALAASKLTRAAYVSCNPETFARDARILNEAGWRIQSVQPVDQFLWSSHIELVALLGRH